MTKEARSRLMSRIKSKDTGPERKMRDALDKAGLRGRYSMNVRDVWGAPDFVFAKEKVAVFVDGDFWHGILVLRGIGVVVWDMEDRLREVAENKGLSSWWKRKICRNIAMDFAHDAVLAAEGWLVVRVSEWELGALGAAACARVVVKALKERRDRRWRRRTA